MPTNYTPSQVYDKYVALQKQLATNITNKGVTASQTELYDNLIDKVAQIENLKGEERTLENFINALSEPKSIVQLEYPAEPKNLFDIEAFADKIIAKHPTCERVTFDGKRCLKIVNMTASVTQNTLSPAHYIKFNYYSTSADFTKSFMQVKWSGGTAYVDATTANQWATFEQNNPNSYFNWLEAYSENNSTQPIYLDLDSFMVAESNIPYEPYPAPKTLNAKLGSKNLLNADDIKNIQYANIVSKGNGACVIKLSSTDKTITIANLYKGHLPVGTYYFTAKLKIENTLGSTRDNEILVFYNDTVITRWYEANSGDGEYNVSKSFNVTDPSSEVRIDFYPTVNSSSSTPTTEYQATFTDIQLEYGNVATAYTPFISDFSTVNVTRCGKNFLEYPYVETTLTRNGLTFTDNKDGTITVNGTATADTQFRLQDTVVCPNNPNPFNSLIGKKVYINGSPEGSSKDTYAIQWIHAGAYGNGVLTVTTSRYYRFAIFVKSGITVENLVFKPQIELGTTATSYEPYQGQTYTPTATGEVTGITNLYPTTTLLTDNAGVVFEQVTGGFYKEILPSTDKNGITKVYQPSVDSTIDSNIKPENIKKGVKILGILGTYDGN